jgi:hypothetical protein
MIPSGTLVESGGRSFILNIGKVFRTINAKPIVNVKSCQPILASLVAILK